MDICFYNLNHIGDVYFTSFFVNLICKQNPENTFLYWFIQGDAFYLNTPNIKRINHLENSYVRNIENGEPPERLLDNSFMHFIESIPHNKYVKNNFNGKPTLFINTWGSVLDFPDFNLKEAIPVWYKLIKDINQEFSLNIKFEITNPTDIVHSLGNVDTDCRHEIDEKIKNIDTNELTSTIFIFNYIPRSLPFDKRDFCNYVNNLSKTNKILLSNYDQVFEDNKNIFFCDKMFNINKDPYCINLIKIWKIAKLCHKIIILPCGAGWTFIHELNDIKENQIFMYNRTDYQATERLNILVDYILDTSKNLIQNITL